MKERHSEAWEDLNAPVYTEPKEKRKPLTPTRGEARQLFRKMHDEAGTDIGRHLDALSR